MTSPHTLIDYLMMLAFPLGVLSWMAATLMLLWFSHLLRKSTKTLETGIMMRAAFGAAVLMLVTVLVETIWAGASYSPAWYVRIEPAIDALLTIINWSSSLCLIMWLLAGMAFLRYSLMEAAKKTPTGITPGGGISDGAA